MIACGCILPISNVKSCFKQFKPMVISDKDININKSALLCAYEEDCTVKYFLDALVRYEFEDAKAYISKNFVSRFDLIELSEYFCKTNNYKLLAKVEFKKPPKNCITNSIMVIENRNKTSIIHLHLIKEPDIFGKWKIYGIDKE